MPSTFDAEFLAHASPEMLSVFGETVTFTPLGKDDRDITAIVAHEQTPLDDQRSTKRRVERIQVWALDNATTGFTIDEAVSGAAVLLEGDAPSAKWAFQERINESGGMIGLRFMRVVREETGDLTPGVGA